MRLSKRGTLGAVVLAALLLVGGALFAGRKEAGAVTPAKGEGKPALTVALTEPQAVELPQTIAANGNLAAWQEVVIGAEAGGFRLTEVRVNVGDVVKKGQVLAQVSPEVANADLAEARAAVAEARAALAEATANGDRARRVRDTGVMSAQQINQYLTAEKAAAARLDAAEARAAAQATRRGNLRIVAPDDGVISARLATVGALAQAGQELFRMIRGARLEWRAEVTAAELGRIVPGLPVTVRPPGGTVINGKVRALAPTVNPQTRIALVYVDLPADAMTLGARAGMFASGEFVLGNSAALTLPQSAVVQRDGFSYVFRLEAGNRVAQQKVLTGRRVGDRIEVREGVEAGAKLVESGAGFLADGDTVTVVSPAMPAASR